MPSYNKIILIGHLGKDPESRFLASGSAVTSCSLATTEKWVDKTSGQKQEKTTWHNLSLFGKSAERFAEWYQKGDLVMVEGRQHHDKSEKDGQTRYFSKVSVDKFEGFKQPSDQGQQSQGGYQQNQQQSAPQQNNSGFDDFDDNEPAF